MVGFQLSKLYFGFRIPKPWIPDSTDQNYLDSGFRIPDNLTLGESDFSYNRCPIDPGLISSTEDTNRRLSSKYADDKNRRGIRLSTYFIIVSTSVTGSVLHERGLENPV